MTVLPHPPTIDHTFPVYDPKCTELVGPMPPVIFVQLIVATRTPALQQLTSDYGSLFGSLLHAVKYRPEISAALKLLDSCLNFPTDGLYECAMRVLVYLGRTRLMGTFFTAHGDNKLKAFADANWTTTRSTSGFIVFLASSAIAHASRRQHCITMSSSEAELVALADLAIELIYLISLLEFIGYKHDGPVEAATDNKAAYDLCYATDSPHSAKLATRRSQVVQDARAQGRLRGDRQARAHRGQPGRPLYEDPWTSKF